MPYMGTLALGVQSALKMWPRLCQVVTAGFNFMWQRSVIGNYDTH